MRRSAKRPQFGRAMTILVLVICFATVGMAPAGAQDAQQRQAAASAYDRGSAAFLSEDFETAARWFEMANNLAPAPAALLQAIRSHQRAGNDLRAATLALRLADSGDSGPLVDSAQSVLDELAGRFVRVDVSCDDECAIEADGALTGQPSFFVSPGEAHEVAAGFSSGTQNATVRGAAGSVRALEFQAPEGEPIVTIEPEESGGIHPAYFVTSLILTAGAGAVLTWSGLDVLSDNDDYEAEVEAGNIDRARVLLANGLDEERRTNILIGVTSGMAVLTLVLGIVTDWGGEDPAESSAHLVVGPTGAGVTGTF